MEVKGAGKDCGGRNGAYGYCVSVLLVNFFMEGFSNIEHTKCSAVANEKNA